MDAIAIIAIALLAIIVGRKYWSGTTTVVGVFSLYALLFKSNSLPTPPTTNLSNSTVHLDMPDF